MFREKKSSKKIPPKKISLTHPVSLPQKILRYGSLNGNTKSANDVKIVDPLVPGGITFEALHCSHGNSAGKIVILPLDADLYADSANLVVNQEGRSIRCCEIVNRNSFSQQTGPVGNKGPGESTRSPGEGNEGTKNKRDQDNIDVYGALEALDMLNGTDEMQSSILITRSGYFGCTFLSSVCILLARKCA